MVRAMRQALTNAPASASNSPAANAPAAVQTPAPKIPSPVPLPTRTTNAPSVITSAPAPSTQSAPAMVTGAIPVRTATNTLAPASQPAITTAPTGPPSFPSPAPGGALAPPTGVPLPQGQTAAAQADENRIIPQGMLQINNMPLEQFFEIYSMISGRTILRPFALSTVQGVTLKAQNELTVKEAVYAMDAVLALNQIAMIPVNGKFVKAVPSQMAAAEGAELGNIKAGNFSETEQFVTQIVTLKTVHPSELAQVLATFSKVPNGITPFDNNNTIVLRDHASNVKRMLEVIERVDVQVESDYKLEVIPIKYGKVADLYNTMSSLISGTAGAGFASGATQQRTAARQTGRMGTGGLRSSSSRYGQRGSAFNPQQNQPATPTPPGAAQNTFQNRLQQIVNRASQDQVELLQDARIVPDERSNTLLIFANKRDIEMITNIVAKVDVLLAQVLIEAVILEVQLRDSDKLGVSMLQNPKRFGNDFSGAGGINNGQGFLNNITNLSSGLPGGFSYFGNIGGDLDVAVTAIADNSTVNVVSRPRIQTSHAIPGMFVVADEIPFVTGSYPNYGYGYGGIAGGAGYANQSIVERIDVGVTLSVTPFITPEGLVVMEIQQEANQKGGDVIIDGNPNPIVNKRTAEATLTVKDGQTIMMGGFITDRKSKNKSGVPVLKDIPLLGALFRSHNNSNDRSELIVLMRATVLPSPERAAEVATREKSILPGIQQAERQFQENEQRLLKKNSKSSKNLKSPNGSNR